MIRIADCWNLTKEAFIIQLVVEGDSFENEISEFKKHLNQTFPEKFFLIHTVERGFYYGH